MSNESGEKQNISHNPYELKNGVGTSTEVNLLDYSTAANASTIDPTKAAARNDNWSRLTASKGKAAKKWANQNGVMKIIPTRQIQLFSYSTVSDILDGVTKPTTQIVPITNLSVNPHQISFDFFSTTEGCIGVSNVAEKVMSIECDIYVTDLVYYWWNHGTSKKGFGFNDLSLDDMLLQKKKTKDFDDYVGSAKNKKDKKKNKECKNITKKIDSWKDFESTVDFTKVRNTFLTYYTGWECKFVSHAFPTFYGVITDIKYDISEGETFAKWHIKIEEALFLSYSGGQEKKDPTKENTQTSGGTQSESGEANTESSEENQ